jgi:hypothetical protein
VSIVNTGTSRCPLVMNLVRQLFDIAVFNDFDIRLKHIPGMHNIAADRLSRLDVKGFRLLFPDVCEQPSVCVR